MKIKANKDYIELFATALNKGLEQIELACKIYVEAIDKDPDAKDLFSVKFSDSIPHTMWAGFEAVGRGSLHRGLLFGGGKNARYIKKLTYSDQKVIMGGGKLEMVTTTGDTLKVDPLTISKAQADQLFSGSEIRTPSEQRAYVESTERTPESSPATNDVKFVVKGKKVIILKGCVMSADEIKQIVMELG